MHGPPLSPVSGIFPNTAGLVYLRVSSAHRHGLVIFLCLLPLIILNSTSVPPGGEAGDIQNQLKPAVTDI